MQLNNIHLMYTQLGPADEDIPFLCNNTRNNIYKQSYRPTKTKPIQLKLGRSCSKVINDTGNSANITNVIGSISSKKELTSNTLKTIQEISNKSTFDINKSESVLQAVNINKRQCDSKLTIKLNFDVETANNSCSFLTLERITTQHQTSLEICHVTQEKLNNIQMIQLRKIAQIVLIILKLLSEVQLHKILLERNILTSLKCDTSFTTNVVFTPILRDLQWNMSTIRLCNVKKNKKPVTKITNRNLHKKGYCSFEVKHEQKKLSPIADMYIQLSEQIWTVSSEYSKKPILQRSHHCEFQSEDRNLSPMAQMYILLSYY